MIFLLIALLAIAPLPLGSVVPIAQSSLSGVSLLLFALSMLFRYQQYLEWPPLGLKAISWSAPLYLTVCGWALVQATSLTPISWHHPVWASASETLNLPSAGAISLHPMASIRDAISLAGYGSVFLIALFECRNPKHAQLLLKAIASIVLIYSAYALAVYFSGNTSVAWEPKRHYFDAATGTFINRNSFGLFIGIGLLAAVCILASSISAGIPKNSRAQVKAKYVMEALAQTWPWVIGLLLTGTTLLLTGSRGASAATAFAVLFTLPAYLLAKRASIWSISIGMVSTLLIATFVASHSGDFLAGRLADSEQAAEGRLAIYQLTWQAIQDHFWLGAGYGAFEDAFALYDTDALALGPRYVAAHSVYLEAILELGIVAAMMLFAALLLIVSVNFIGLVRRRKHRIFAAFALGSTLLIALQGTIDFGIQTPAIATLYAAILGLGAAQSVSSLRN